MAKNNEAKIKFTAETKEFNEDIKKSNDEMSRLRAELKLNETEMQATGKSVEALENKHRILSEQLEQSESKTEALRKKLEKAKEVFGENSTEANKLEIQLLNAQTAEVKLRDAVSDAEYELDRFNKGLEEAGEKSKEASDGFTVMKGALADLVADGISNAASAIGEIGTEAFTMANDVDKATNTFVAKTGESVEESERFKDVMTDIYNDNFGESFDDIAQSMATVKTALGDIGDDELKKVTTDALMLRDTFDMDVNESIRAVNSMMDQFGISADEAYSLIAQGAQNGLNQNGDLLDTVNEYSVQFQNAGYSAEDMFNMLSNGVSTGTWSVDKLGDAVKEFNIRMSDGSAKDAVEALGFSWESVSEEWSKGGDSAKDVFNMLFSELDGLENTTEGYGIGVGLLGTMYEDLGQDAILALSNTNGEISKSKNALEEINSVKYNDIGSALEGVKRNLMTSVSEPLNEDVLPKLNEFITTVDWDAVGQNISNGISAGIDAISTFAGAVKDSITWMKEHQGVVIAVASVIGILVTAISAYNAVQAIKAAMDAAQVTTVWGLVAAHWAQATAAMAAIAPYVLVVAAIAAVIAIVVLCIKYWDEIVAALKKAWESIKAVWDKVAPYFKALWEKIKNSFQFQLLVAGFKAAWEGIKLAWSVVVDYFKMVWNNIKTIFSVVKSVLSGDFRGAWEGIKSIWSNVSNFFKGVIDKIKNTFSKVGEIIRKPFQTAIDKVKNIFSSLKLSFPSIKLPHFKVKPAGWKIGDLLKGSIPSLGIEWYKDGGIFTKPTIFSTNSGLKGVGEAGAEAVLPIDRLQGYISGAIEKAQNVVNLQSLANAIEDLANRPTELYIGDRQIALATASANDNVNGLRSTFRSRGLALD